MMGHQCLTDYKERGNARIKNSTMPNQYTKAKEEGRPKPELTKEGRQKIRETNANRDWTEEKRQNHSSSMIKAVKEHPDSYTKNNVSGRVKIVEHNGHMLKGSWEVKVAKWLDSQNIPYKVEHKGFDYVYENITRQYFPDFYLPDLDVYIEVKGWKRDKDVAKWSQFPEKLVIIDKTNIDTLDEYNVQEVIKSGAYK